LRRKRRRGEVVERLRLVGHAAVAPAGRDRVQEVAGEVDAVAGLEGHDVRARHRARAAPLHSRLGRVDHVEAAEARVVRRRLPLRPSAGRVHGQKDGGVTSLAEKISVKKPFWLLFIYFLFEETHCSIALQFPEDEGPCMLSYVLTMHVCPLVSV
jgi:hypothetical protein